MGGRDATGGRSATGGMTQAGGERATGGANATAGADQTGTSDSPVVGAHALSYYRVGNNPSSISTPAITTRPSGSALIVGVGRGELSAHQLPVDNKGNEPFVQLGAAHSYTQWQGSGTALYAFVSAKGGANHIVSVSTPPQDEVTLAVVEVSNGREVTDYKWNEVLAGSPVTSRAVTTSGPATLVAFWWGDAGSDGQKTAKPNNGFAVVESILQSGALVQCAVATREVAAAGTYDVTWTATPTQGAQLWIVAVE
jgi:hypothetical protein